MYDEIIELKKVLFLSALGWRYAAKPSTAMGVSWGSCGKGAGHRATLSLHRGGRPTGLGTAQHQPRGCPASARGANAGGRVALSPSAPRGAALRSPLSAASLSMLPQR